MLFGLEFEKVELLVLDKGRKEGFFLLLGEKSAEAGGLHHPSLHFEEGGAAGYFDVGDVVEGGGHLAGDETFPDKLVEPEKVVGEELLEAFGCALDGGGSNGLVCFLGPLAGFEEVGFLRQEGISEAAADVGSDFGEGFALYPTGFADWTSTGVYLTPEPASLMLLALVGLVLRRR